MEEQYVSFETAKLAKEVGFDLPCKRFFRDKGIQCESNVPSNSNVIEEEYSQPTQEVLNNWLIENYALKVTIVEDYANSITRFYEPNMSYEKVYELGLKHILELLKNEYFK